jgi:hypothetical protein
VYLRKGAVTKPRKKKTKIQTKRAHEEENEAEATYQGRRDEGQCKEGRAT